MLGIIFASLQWRSLQIDERKNLAIRLVEQYLNNPNHLGASVVSAPPHELSAHLLSWIRGDIVVTWKARDLRWTVNVLTHQVYRWQSLQKQKNPDVEDQGLSK